MLSNKTIMQFESISFTATDSSNNSLYFHVFAGFCLKSSILILTIATSQVTASCFNLFLFTGSLKRLLY